MVRPSAWPEYSVGTWGGWHGPRPVRLAGRQQPCQATETVPLTRALPLPLSRFGLWFMAMNKSPTFGLTSRFAKAFEHAVSVIIGKRQLRGTSYPQNPVARL